MKVVDFGIAKSKDQSHKTKTGLIKGKIAYMPVEQLQGQQLDRRVDVYALGLVLYELLTGKYPFEASTDVSMMQAILFEPLVPALVRRPDLPQELVNILDRALAKVREQRYPDCISFQADLERYILSTGQPVGARDLAQWVERLCPRSSGTAKPTPTPEGTDLGFNATFMSPQRTPGGETGRATMAFPLDAAPGPGTPPDKSRVRTAPTHSIAQQAEPPLEPTLISPSRRDLPTVAPVRTTGLQNEAAPGKVAAPEKPVSVENPEAAPLNRRRRAGLGAVVGGLVLLAVGSGVVLFRSTPTSQGPSQPAPPAPMQAVPTPPPEPQPVVAAPPPAEPPPVAAAQPEPPPVASEPVAAQASEPAGEKPSPEPTPPAPTEAQPVRRKAAKAKLEFRIRPYATVFVDGKAIGQTPLKPVQVPIGTHTVRLINRDLGKDVTRTIEVKAGQANILKHDLSAD